MLILCLHLYISSSLTCNKVYITCHKRAFDTSVNTRYGMIYYNFKFVSQTTLLFYEMPFYSWMRNFNEHRRSGVFWIFVRNGINERLSNFSFFNLRPTFRNGTASIVDVWLHSLFHTDIKIVKWFTAF